jgi:hypothetical protein
MAGYRSLDISFYQARPKGWDLVLSEVWFDLMSPEKYSEQMC